MDMSLMLLEHVTLSNSHWSVFNLQELPGNEELTRNRLKPLFKSLFNILLDFFLRFKIRRECTIHWNKKKRKKQNIKEFELANSDPKGEDYQSVNSSL